MGRLIAKAYRSSSLAYLADHTYVECGAGAKGWGCWGGKQGGKTLSAAIGSTVRADTIAEPDECGGITCYAINGVCHQAANRILSPADIDVDGAAGYGLSKFVFGVYGRECGPFGRCEAPFDEQEAVSGDLDECGDVGPDQPRTVRSQEATRRFRAVAEETRALFAREDLTGPSREARIEFQLAQVRILVMNTMERYPRYWEEILDIQAQFESERVDLEDQLTDGLPREVFPTQFNELTIKYQNDLVEALPPQVYVAMLRSPPGKAFALCDPELFNPDLGPGFRRGPNRDFRQR